jgi:CheY-like chemotaxis protein
MLVCVVDDDDAVRTAIIRLLEADGHRTCWASDGPGALAIMDSEMPDLVLLDVTLKPGMNGIDVMIQKRQNPKLDPIRVALVTGSSAAQVHELAARAQHPLEGVLEILGKPVHHVDLTALLRRIRPSYRPPSELGPEEKTKP